MSVNAIKSEEEAELCRCCHAEGSFKNLHTTYYWMDGEPVVYANLLRESLNIELLGVKSSMQQTLCSICYTCIQRLEDAVKFKRQVGKCETRFQSIYVNSVSCDPIFEVKIKDELDPAESSCEVKNDDTALDTIITEEDHTWDDDCKDTDYAPTIQIVPLKVRKKGQKHKQKNHKQKSNKVKHKTNKQGTDNLGREEMDFSEDIHDILKNYKPGPGRKVPVLPFKNYLSGPGKKVSLLPDYDPKCNEDARKHISRTIIKKDIDFKVTDNGFQCLKCPTIEKDSRNIRLHIKTVHLNIPKHSCPTCNEAFSSLSVFTKHKLDEHNIDDRFKCNACEHAFNTKVQLKRHINTFHMLGEKIKCKQCEYETFSIESLYKHNFKHKTVKDYQCKYCKKAFLRKTTMQLHERIHTGDRRKVCAVCGQAFVQKASLNYHMTKYHPEVAF